MSYSPMFELCYYEEQLHNVNHCDLNPNLLPERINALRIEINDELKRIRHTFRDVHVKTHADDHLERYFQLHQREAIRLMNIASAKREEQELFGMLFDSLSAILDIIEQDYSKYFDLNAPVPDFYFQTTVVNLSQDRNILSGKMKAKSVEPVLQEVILEYLRNFARQAGSNFRQMIYAKMMTKRLLTLVSVDADKDWTMKIIIELIYLNFNKVSFLKHCRYEMAAHVEKLKNVTEQKTKFHWFSKELETLEIKPNIGYRIEREGLRDHLMSYVATELIFLSEWEKLHPELAGAEFKRRAEQVVYKLPLSLSVPELAYIARLFMETGVFIVEKGQIITVMKFFADHVTTRGTDRISAERMSKLGNPEAKTRDAVEHILLEMLNKLRGGNSRLSLGMG